MTFMLQSGMAILFMILLPYKVMGQSIQTIEHKLCYYIDKINHRYDADSFEYFQTYNDSLQNYLINTLPENNQTIEATFPLARKKHLSIVTSADKKFRLYSWNQNGSGTMQGYSSVLQYKTSNGIAVQRIYPLHGIGADMPKDTGAPGMRYTHLYTLQAKNRPPVYLCFGRSIEDSRLMSFELKAYTVNSDKLSSIPIFEDGGKLQNNVGYEIELSNDDLEKEKLPELHFSKDMMVLYVPHVDGKSLKFNGKYLSYKFNGNNYVFDKNAK